MKTYIAFTTKGLVTIMAKNKKNAYEKVSENGYKCNKGNIIISSVHYDYNQGSIKIQL